MGGCRSDTRTPHVRRSSCTRIDPEPKHDSFPKLEDIKWAAHGSYCTAVADTPCQNLSLRLPASPVAKASQPPPSPHHDKPRSMQAVAKAAAQTRQPFSPPSDRTPGPLPPRAPPAATAHRGLSLLTFSAGGKGLGEPGCQPHAMSGQTRLTRA